MTLLLLWRTLFGFLVGPSCLGSTTFRGDALLLSSFVYQPIIMAEMTVLAEGDRFGSGAKLGRRAHDLWERSGGPDISGRSFGTSDQILDDSGSLGLTILCQEVGPTGLSCRNRRRRVL